MASTGRNSTMSDADNKYVSWSHLAFHNELDLLYTSTHVRAHLGSASYCQNGNWQHLVFIINSEKYCTAWNFSVHDNSQL